MVWNKILAMRKVPPHETERDADLFPIFRIFSIEIRYLQPKTFLNRTLYSQWRFFL